MPGHHSKTHAKYQLISMFQELDVFRDKIIKIKDRFLKNRKMQLINAFCLS
jgi:hypothetical protein